MVTYSSRLDIIPLKEQVEKHVFAEGGYFIIVQESENN